MGGTIDRGGNLKKYGQIETYIFINTNKNYALGMPFSGSSLGLEPSTESKKPVNSFKDSLRTK